MDPVETGETRISPTSLRTGEASLPEAIRSGDITPVVQELRRKYRKIADVKRRVQSQLVGYLTVGGIISYDINDTPGSIAELDSSNYVALRENVRSALH